MSISGDHCALYFSFFVGVQGLLALSLYAYSGALAQEHLALRDWLILLLGGTVDSVGMATAIYAASIGISGISFAVANTDCIYVLLFNAVVRQ